MCLIKYSQRKRVSYFNYTQKKKNHLVSDCYKDLTKWSEKQSIMTLVVDDGNDSFQGQGPVPRKFFQFQCTDSVTDSGFPFQEDASLKKSQVLIQGDFHDTEFGFQWRPFQEHELSSRLYWKTAKFFNVNPMTMKPLFACVFEKISILSVGLLLFSIISNEFAGNVVLYYVWYTNERSDIVTLIGIQGRWVQFWHPFRPPSAGLIFDRSGGGAKNQKIKLFVWTPKVSFIGFQGRWVQFWHPFRPPSAGLIFDRSGGGGKKSKNITFCMDSKSEFIGFQGRWVQFWHPFRPPSAGLTKRMPELNSATLKTYKTHFWSPYKKFYFLIFCPPPGPVEN